VRERIDRKGKTKETYERSDSYLAKRGAFPGERKRAKPTARRGGKGRNEVLGRQ